LRRRRRRWWRGSRWQRWCGAAHRCRCGGVWCGLAGGCLRCHNRGVLAGIGSGVGDDENPCRDDGGGRAGECGRRPPGAIPRPGSVVSCPHAALWQRLKVRRCAATDRGQVLIVRPSCRCRWVHVPKVVTAGCRPPGGGVSLVVPSGKSLLHTGIGAVYDAGGGGGRAVGRLAGPIVPQAIPRLFAVIAAGRRRRWRARAGSVPLVCVRRREHAALCVPIWRQVTGIGSAVRWCRVGDLLERGKRECLLRGAAKDTAFGKPIDPPHRSSVSVHEECVAH
jgi:hypothetical protein